MQNEKLKLFLVEDEWVECEKCEIWSWACLMKSYNSKSKKYTCSFCNLGYPSNISTKEDIKKFQEKIKYIKD